MRSSRVLCLLLSLFFIFSAAWLPAAAVWTIEDLEVDPWAELDGLRGMGPAADVLPEISVYEFDDVASVDQSVMFSEEGIAAQEDGTSISFMDGVISASAKVYLALEYYVPKQDLGSVVLPAAWYPASSDIMVFDSFTRCQNIAFLAGESSQYTTFPVIDLPSNATSVRDEVCRYSFSTVVTYTFPQSVASFSLTGTCRCYFTVRFPDHYYCYPSTLYLYVDGQVVHSFPVSATGIVDFGGYEYSSLYNDIGSFSLSFSGIGSRSGDYEGLSFNGCQTGFMSSGTDFVIDIDIVDSKTFREGVLSGLGSIFQGILELPGKIVNLLVEGLKSLFIPSQDDLTEIQGKYQQLLSDRLGFIWQAGEWITGFFSAVVDEFQDATPYTFVFPGIMFEMDGEEYVILAETEVSLDNAVMDVLRPVLGTAVCFIAAVAFINTAESMVMALISGVSYFSYIHRREDGS